MSCVEGNAAARDGFILPGHSDAEGGSGSAARETKNEGHDLRRVLHLVETTELESVTSCV